MPRKRRGWHTEPPDHAPDDSDNALNDQEVHEESDSEARRGKEATRHEKQLLGEREDRGSDSSRNSRSQSARSRRASSPHQEQHQERVRPQSDRQRRGQGRKRSQPRIHDMAGEAPRVKDQVDPQYDEYLALLQEKNRILKKMKEKEKTKTKRKASKQREEGFSLYTNGANSQQAAKRAARDAAVRQKRQSRGSNRRNHQASPHELEEKERASSDLGESISRRKNWTVQSAMKIMAEDGTAEVIETPSEFTGVYDDDFEEVEEDGDFSDDFDGDYGHDTGKGREDDDDDDDDDDDAVAEESIAELDDDSEDEERMVGDASSQQGRREEWGKSPVMDAPPSSVRESIEQPLSPLDDRNHLRKSSCSIRTDESVQTPLSHEARDNNSNNEPHIADDGDDGNDDGNDDNGVMSFGSNDGTSDASKHDETISLASTIDLEDRAVFDSSVLPNASETLRPPTGRPSGYYKRITSILGDSDDGGDGDDNDNDDDDEEGRGGNWSRDFDSDDGRKEHGDAGEEGTKRARSDTSTEYIRAGRDAMPRDSPAIGGKVQVNKTVLARQQRAMERQKELEQKNRRKKKKENSEREKRIAKGQGSSKDAPKEASINKTSSTNSDDQLTSTEKRDLQRKELKAHMRAQKKQLAEQQQQQVHVEADTDDAANNNKSGNSAVHDNEADCSSMQKQIDTSSISSTKEPHARANSMSDEVVPPSTRAEKTPAQARGKGKGKGKKGKLPADDFSAGTVSKYDVKRLRKYGKRVKVQIESTWSSFGSREVGLTKIELLDEYTHPIRAGGDTWIVLVNGLYLAPAHVALTTGTSHTTDSRSMWLYVVEDTPKQDSEEEPQSVGDRDGGSGLDDAATQPAKRLPALTILCEPQLRPSVMRIWNYNRWNCETNGVKDIAVSDETTTWSGCVPVGSGRKNKPSHLDVDLQELFVFGAEDSSDGSPFRDEQTNRVESVNSADSGPQKSKSHATRPGEMSPSTPLATSASIPFWCRQDVAENQPTLAHRSDSRSGRKKWGRGEQAGEDDDDRDKKLPSCQELESKHGETPKNKKKGNAMAKKAKKRPEWVTDFSTADQEQQLDQHQGKSGSQTEARMHSKIGESENASTEANEMQHAATHSPHSVDADANEGHQRGPLPPSSRAQARKSSLREVFSRGNPYEQQLEARRASSARTGRQPNEFTRMLQDQAQQHHQQHEQHFGGHHHEHDDDGDDDGNGNGPGRRKKSVGMDYRERISQFRESITRSNPYLSSQGQQNVVAQATEASHHHGGNGLRAQIPLPSEEVSEPPQQQQQQQQQQRQSSFAALFGRDPPHVQQQQQQQYRHGENHHPSNQEGGFFGHGQLHRSHSAQSLQEALASSKKGRVSSPALWLKRN